jgi:choline dehydrogenase
VSARYDVVIVGGGSAGCALANRLSADPSTSVLVLEAGRPDYKWDVFIHMPAGLATPIGNRFYDWKYESEPEPFMNGRRIYHARGKVLGGSSSINGMIFQRGNPLDYERWGADPGMGSWDYAHCLPYFKRMESCLAGADEFRGGDGPLVLERGPATSPLFEAFFEAVQQAGYPLTDDVNGFKQEASPPSTATSTTAVGSALRARTCTRSGTGRTSMFAAARSSTGSCSTRIGRSGSRWRGGPARSGSRPAR